MRRVALKYLDAACRYLQWKRKGECHEEDHLGRRVRAAGSMRQLAATACRSAPGDNTSASADTSVAERRDRPTAIAGLRRHDHGRATSATCRRSASSCSASSSRRSSRPSRRSTGTRRRSPTSRRSAISSRPSPTSFDTETHRGRLRQVQPRGLRREAVRADGGAWPQRGTGHGRLHQVPRLACVSSSRVSAARSDGLRRHDRRDRAVRRRAAAR